MVGLAPNFQTALATLAPVQMALLVIGVRIEVHQINTTILFLEVLSVPLKFNSLPPCVYVILQILVQKMINFHLFLESFILDFKVLHLSLILNHFKLVS